MKKDLGDAADLKLLGLFEQVCALCPMAAPVLGNRQLTDHEDAQIDQALPFVKRNAIETGWHRGRKASSLDE